MCRFLRRAALALALCGGVSVTPAGAQIGSPPEPAVTGFAEWPRGPEVVVPAQGPQGSGLMQVATPLKTAPAVGESYVTTGVLFLTDPPPTFMPFVPARAPAVPPAATSPATRPAAKSSANPAATQVRGTIEAAFGPQVREVDVKMEGTKAAIQFTTRTEMEGSAIAEAIMRMPDLGSYAVDVTVKVQR